MIRREVILVIAFLLIINFSAMLVSAEKLDIQIENNYVPGQEVNFKIILYDDKNNKISVTLTSVFYFNTLEVKYWCLNPF